jgi:hypothetical protein
MGPSTPARTHRKTFWKRMLMHSAISLGLLGVSLAVGIWGYRHYEHLPWRDAFLNAAMLLGGMGPGPIRSCRTLRGVWLRDLRGGRTDSRAPRLNSPGASQGSRPSQKEDCAWNRLSSCSPP